MGPSGVHLASRLPRPGNRPCERLLQVRRGAYGLALLLVACISVYGLVYSRTVSYELRLNQRQRDVKQLKEDNALLRARVVQAQSAARIDEQVTQTLRMQLPERIEYAQVPRDILADAAGTAAENARTENPPPQGY